MTRPPRSSPFFPPPPLSLFFRAAAWRATPPRYFGIFSLALSPGLGVRRKHIFHPLQTPACGARQHALDHFRNAQEREPLLEKCGNRDFVGGIQCTWIRPAFSHGFPR